jgi:predicted nucleotidyltransferase
MNRDEVIGVLSSHRRELKERFGVSSLALFGSVARDEAGPESDVDLLVEFRETPGLSEYMGLKFWLEDRLGRQVNRYTEGREVEAFDSVSESTKLGRLFVT